jgi:hypothetical protein
MRMKLVPPNLFERFVGMGFAYETTTHHLRERDQ